MYNGKKTYLRLLELSDLDIIMQHYNNLELLYTLGDQRPRSRDQWEERIRKSSNDERSYRFAICTKEQRFIGLIGLFQSGKNLCRRADLGLLIFNKEDRGKGYGTDAIITMCGFAFTILNMHTVELELFEFNKAGQKAYEKAGFVHTGRRRDAYYHFGNYVDSLIMDIKKEEFNSKFPDFSLLADN